jgi:hypothetical protein
MVSWRRGTLALIATVFVGAASQFAPASAAAQAGGFTCTEVIGYSQTAQWFNGGFAPLARNGQWQLRWFSGGSIDQWAAGAGFPGWDSQYLVSHCASNSNTPDRVVLDVTGDYRTDPTWWSTQAGLAITNIHRKYPSVRQIALEPVVGGPGGAQCPVPGGRPVRASFNHPYINQGIDRLLGGDVVRGPDPTVRTCADYRDDTGHLVDDAQQAVGQSIAQFWTGGGAPAPAAPPAPAPMPAGDGFCAPDESPGFNLGFLSLSQQLGGAMGGPMECEHGNPENGDTLQETSTGLAFYRASTNTPTFTDGFQHWALTAFGLVTWTGAAIDPP